MAKRRGTTIHLRGSWLNDYFAARMLETRTPEEALASTVGPAREAVEREIARKAKQSEPPQ